jgi:hypothetical protein
MDSPFTIPQGHELFNVYNKHTICQHCVHTTHYTAYLQKSGVLSLFLGKMISLVALARSEKRKSSLSQPGI